jgi:hypothetical protein
VVAMGCWIALVTTLLRIEDFSPMDREEEDGDRRDSWTLLILETDWVVKAVVDDEAKRKP